ncbi:choice-of-anchor I family protein [Planomicrobium sp. CPCC 101079]|uniref:choice-of-anchor I family protein n=1 Tax=Planomicrobium sp. CPCC 101079 TaxID=2599618 RepID=UPI001646301A|nr:choice-of-anchor I family protein [Planomicrobium sp. CPCC 101079]
MQKFIPTAAVCALSLSILAVPSPTAASENLTHFEKGKQGLDVELVGRYKSGAKIDEGGTEIVVYDPNTFRAFSVNGAEKALDILDMTVLKTDNTTDIPLMTRIPLSELGVEASDVTSVAIHPDGGYIAVAAPAVNKEEPGYVVFLTVDGEPIANVQVGALPDMLTFTPDGSKLLVANEGEPAEDYSVNPEGTVSVIDVSSDIGTISDKAVSTVSFDEKIIEDDVRKVHPGSTYAEDLEPEYITVDKDGRYAYVALQENNALAKLDIKKEQFVAVKSLGYKDSSISQNKLDASNKDDAINIRNWPVLSMYQPDGITSFEADGKTFILSANEGDLQDWEGFSEETRVADIKDEYQLNADLYKGYNQNRLDKLVENGLFEEEELGRLTTSISQPKNEDGKYEAIYGHGGRSFSVWEAGSMELAYDSGDDFEQISAKVYPDFFNSSNDEDSFDNRSDDKGPEPESVITGNIQGTNYAFIGLERQGGIMVYDLSKPAAPKFDTYFSSRIFNGEESPITEQSGDVAPEGLTFVPSDQSPTGQDLLLAAHEVSGTIAVYSLEEKANGNKNASSKSLSDIANSILVAPKRLVSFLSK